MKTTLDRIGRACLPLVLLGATACGPETSSSIRMTGHAVDVVFGDKATPSAAPLVVVPGANPQPHFPSLIEPQLPDFDQPRTTPTPLPVLPTFSPSPCPTVASPGVKEIAPPRVTTHPAPSTYTFARTGSAQRTLPAGAELRLDGLIARAYSAARPADAAQDGVGSFTFDVTETTRDARVVNTYLVSPQGALSGAVGAGLYLDRIVSTTPASGTDVFAPVQPLLLMPFPALEQTTWHSAATDPRSQVTMDVNGLIRGKKRLNFCGQGVDTWEVQLTGQIAGPGRVINITSLVYDVGTQYGGIFLHDELEQNGTDMDGQFQSTQATTITRDPDEGR
jgi:hypothetical protein